MVRQSGVMVFGLLSFRSSVIWTPVDLERLRQPPLMFQCSSPARLTKFNSSRLGFAQLNDSLNVVGLRKQIHESHTVDGVAGQRGQISG